ncbi:hypothetical protein BGZ96_010883 [Linnemannia gamsii]|uniref:Poly(A) RNA polymerase mitochondrial-like central palm domain-containing protein n=1 Tax=Linnemannia gamsii TaxID=64522 RepID=A0ABQ7JTD2_9FUNG|nr:hypothetical protein BGZ96_010883 [Linnemannia gamsii]
MNYESTFIYSLLDVIFFECAGNSRTKDNKYPLQKLAETFIHVQKMFLDNYYLQSSDTVAFILQYRLDTLLGLKASLPSLCNLSPFPYKTPVISGPSGTNKDSYIYLPPLTSTQINNFLHNYAVNVPSHYHDEIGRVIWYLRVNYWKSHVGSGGNFLRLSDGSKCVAKYSRAHNTKKRRNSTQSRERGFGKQEVLILQLLQQGMQTQELELEHLEREVSGKNILDARWTNIDNKQHLQGFKEESRYSSLTRYLDELKLQAATLEARGEVENLRHNLETTLRASSTHNQNIEVRLFGSFESGLSTNTSDADFTVLNFVGTKGNPIHELANILSVAGYGPIKTVAGARVPIVSFTAREIRCDMSINQPMGVFNSQLIHAYQRIDPRFLSVWFGVRTLADKHGILCSRTGYLSSYALAMMLIVFLQTIHDPPILPRLQLQNPDRMVPHTIDGYHCAYDQDQRNYSELAAKNILSAGQLMAEFCLYFGYTFDYSTQEVNPRLGLIRNRSVAPPPRSRQDSRPKDWYICILDPFVPTRNVAGNCRANHLADIQACFRSAYDAIEQSDFNKAFKNKSH